MYSAAMVMTPLLANPCSAWSGLRMPSSVRVIIAPTSTTSVSRREVVSRTRTPSTTTNVATISNVTKCS